MLSLKTAVETYIRAKDGNRRHLIAQAFSAGASLTMQVNTTAIAFPSAVSGCEAIADVLVSEFSQKYENVYTFCIGEAPAAGAAWHCDWLVCMTEKGTGNARVGFGEYDWAADPASGLIDALVITIAEMTTLAPDTAQPILQWAQQLPYPWCPASRLTLDTPSFTPVARIVAALSSSANAAA